MQEYSHVFDSINTLIDTLAQIFLNHRESTIQVMGWSDHRIVGASVTWAIYTEGQLLL